MDKKRFGKMVVRHFMNRFREDPEFRRKMIKLFEEAEMGRGPLKLRELIAKLQAKKATKH